MMQFFTQIQTSITIFLICLTLWSGLLPLAQAFLGEAQAQSTNQGSSEQNPREEIEGEKAPGATAAYQPGGQAALKALERSAQVMSLATTDQRRLKLNGVDGPALATLARLAEQIQLNPDAGYSLDNLPPGFDLGETAENLKNYDDRVIRSLLYLITPIEQRGAGHEFLDVASITQGHRTAAGETDDEGPRPEGEEYTSPHVEGKAVDVTAIDYLRGTEFTIEAGSDGKPKLAKDGVKHLPLEPVQVAWQADALQAGTRDGGQPRLNGGSPSASSGDALVRSLAQGFAQGFDRNGFDLVDPQTLLGQLGSVGNLGQLVDQLGRSVLSPVLGSQTPLFLGPTGLRQTGQALIENATDHQIPAFGIFGNNPDELVYNSGREVITRNAGLADGALIGQTSREVISNAGERFWERKLGELPLGTLDGIRAGDRSDLERHLGRGAVAKFFDLQVGSLPLGASAGDFKQALGLAWETLATDGQRVSNTLGIPTTNSVTALESGPDEWLRLIGRSLLAPVEAFAPGHRDAAYNLEARPAIVELPQGTDAERATQLLAQYSFKSAAQSLLESIKSGQTTFLAQWRDAAELRAWLLLEAYDKQTDPNLATLTDRFLTVDTNAFFDTGVEILAKGLTTSPNERSDVRVYLKTGSLPDGSITDLGTVAQAAGFSTRTDFDAVVRDNAPAVGFSHVGRVTWARVLSSTDEEAASFLAKPVPPTAEQFGTRLESVRRSLAGLRGDTSIRRDLDAALVAVDGLLASAGEGKAPTSLNSSGPLAAQLAVLNRAAQSATNSSGTGFEKARALLVATNGLFAPAGEKIYETSSVPFRLPGGPTATRLITQALSGNGSMTQAVERTGGFTFDDVLRVNAGGTYDLVQDVSRSVARGNTKGAQATLARFATREAGPLGEAAQLVNRTVEQFSLNPNITPQLLSTALVAGQQLYTILGGPVADVGFGLSRWLPSTKILRTQPLTAAADEAFRSSIGIRNIAQGVAGQFDLLVDPETVGGLYPASSYSIVGARIGFELGAQGAKSDNPQRLIEQVIGKPLTRAVAAQLGIPDLSPAGLKAFVDQWKFWEDPQLVPRLESVVRGAFPEVGQNLPPGVLATLFDKTIDGKERTKRLEVLVNPYLQARLVDPILLSALDIPGLPTGAVIAAKNILLSKATPEEKSAALRSLGLATADAVTTSQFGVPVTWLVDQTIPAEEKARIGLRIASSQLGLDPNLTVLVDQAYQAFLIDDGIDMSTPGGRAQAAGLVIAAGSAAGVPSEYAAVAAAFITGDVETTALAYAGGQFNRVLAENGIVGIGFQDFYEAFAGPTKATVERMRLDAANEALASSAGDGGGDLQAQLSSHLLAEKLGTYRQAKQETLLFASMDMAIGQATGLRGITGIGRAFMRGTLTDQAAAAGQLISAISGSPEAAFILGNKQVVEDIQKFAKSGNFADVSSGSFAVLDGYLAATAGIPIPPGTSESVLKFSQSGNVDDLAPIANPDTLVAFGGGYIDEALGIPQGATAAMYGAYRNVEAAQATFNAATLDDLVQGQSLGFDFGLGGSGAAQAAAQQLGMAYAGLVSTGVNLIFGETFSKLDQSLGLPSGAISTLISTGIYAAMVPGIALGSLLLTTVLPWAAPLLLAEIFGFDLGSLFGDLFGGLLGGGKKAQKVVIWSSFTDRWPEEVPYNCLKKGQELTQDQKDADKDRPKGQAVALGDTTCEVGTEVAFATRLLPAGLFLGPPPEQLAQSYEIGKRVASNTNIERLIGDLLAIGQRDHLDDESMTPLQIRSHARSHGQNLQSLMDIAWGDGTVGDYFQSISGNFSPSRKGYVYDEPGQVPYFLKHLHWNY